MTNGAVAKCVTEFKKGNLGAFEELYRGLCTEVRMFSYSIVKDYQLSEDIMQDVFIKLYSDMGQFEERSAFKTYIFAITKNKSLNAIRSRRYHANLDEVYGTELADPAYGNTDSRASDRLLIDSMLQSLNDQERQIVLLKASGFGHAEIAKILEIPAGTVMWKYNKCKQELKRQFAGDQQ